ncbi:MULTISPECIES: lipopolysaccharide biosynthesis protein [Sellimonas]|uniref:Polysaccharide biosynthesis protein n=2 Tax=Sellimonas TaxID=1769710 RepID=A0ABS7L480_9FIRM|nr:hypothetical protein [Sellimonas caecigallum]MBY0757838.1 hypothetical protein [Sellimonas caecigallum]
MKVGSVVKNLSYSVLANGTNTLVSMILVLFVPKILGVKEYSYWQLYLFYASYVGFFHFGWADGVYLKFGGKKYSELDKGYFHSQFWLLTIFEIILALIFGAATYLFCDDANKEAVLLAVAFCCVLQIPRTFLQYLLQTTNRIVDYARNYLLEKIVYAVLVIGFLAAGIRNFQILIGADLFARGLTLVLLSRECKDIVKGKVIDWKNGIREAWDNVSIGIKLMIANIAGQLLVGIVRFAIENHWSVEVFGKVSLTITASNLLLAFISAVSIVIYPMLKNMDEEHYVQIYTKMRNILMIFVLGLLIVYYPAKVILSWWLPKYAESLQYMALLFPMCVFESKLTLLISTYLKALRREKQFMIINWISVGITLIGTGITVYLLDNLTFAIAMLPVLMGIRCCIGEALLSRALHFSLWKDMAAECVLAGGFILISWNIQSWLSTGLYLCMYLIYLVWKREFLKETVHEVKKRIFNR